MRALLILVLASSVAQDGPVRDLIRQLEDDNAEARDRAQKQLGALGEDALPALRDVASSPAASGELKLRAAAAIREIELGAKVARIYREPKKLTLRASDTMLREILDEIARQASVTIDASAVDGAAKVTFDAKDLSLMELLDLVCRGQAERTWEMRDDGTVRLLRDRHVDYPSVYAGPFRVRLSSMSADRSTDFKARTVTLNLGIVAEWDRRLKPSRIVDIELSKAADDRGTALDITPVDMNTVIRGGPGVQLRVGVGMAPDGSENARSFLVRNIAPAAATVDLEGVARYTFPLDQREVRIDKPSTTETKDLGDTMVRITRAGTSENWTVSFHKTPAAATPGWSRMIGQRFDPESFVVVNEDGVESPVPLRSINRGRQFMDSAEVGVWFQGFCQRNTSKAVKEVRFRFVDQTMVKTVPFKFTALPLP